MTEAEHKAQQEAAKEAAEKDEDASDFELDFGAAEMGGALMTRIIGPQSRRRPDPGPDSGRPTKVPKTGDGRSEASVNPQGGDDDQAKRRNYNALGEGGKDPDSEAPGKRRKGEEPETGKNKNRGVAPSP